MAEENHKTHQSGT